MRVVFERDLDASPDQVWAWLTVPELMSEWSTAPVTRDLPEGDPNRPGFTRIVSMRSLGVPARLAEIVTAAEPPHRYEYTVRPNVFVRRHAATQKLDPLKGGRSHLTWTVEIEAWLPGLMHLFVLLTRRQLERSLNALERCVSRGQPSDE